jgi:membrane-bound serine protease (ClpP class)
VLIIVAIILLLVLPSPWSAIAFVVTTVLWIVEVLAWNRTVKNRRRVVGAETLIGRTAVVSAPCFPEGQVRLDGETWDARCAAGANPGDEVRITGRDKLTLIVEPAEPGTHSSG